MIYPHDLTIPLMAISMRNKILEKCKFIRRFVIQTQDGLKRFNYKFLILSEHVSKNKRRFLNENSIPWIKKS